MRPPPPAPPRSTKPPALLFSSNLEQIYPSKSFFHDLLRRTTTKARGENDPPLYEMAFSRRSSRRVGRVRVVLGNGV